LSLRVGENLNPQFLFSSGQRRAAGLAFLLSVHLSRPWCRWQTIVLDDAVQHIDDYRALHLVEVLAALRQSQRQVICAVEDASLADLLARRLRSTFNSPGRRFDLGLTEEGCAGIVRRVEVPPMPAGVLRHASEITAAE
jgi:recombinational DNA repair ATPase RecF